jgi:hypothetical protein
MYVDLKSNILFALHLHCINTFSNLFKDRFKSVKYDTLDFQHKQICMYKKHI